MRTSSGILLVSGLLAVVAIGGCTSTTTASCDPEWSTGGLADTVTVDGGFADTPEVSFPTPLVQLDETTSAVLTVGDGELVAAGAVVEGVVNIYDGATGERLTGGTALWSVDRDEPHVTAAARCETVGSRIVTVGPASVVFGPSAVEGVDDATIVSVFDVTAVYLGRADGVDQLPLNGLPTIALAPDGRPGFTFTNSPAPTDLVVSVLKQGSGATVQEGDSVVLQYTGVSWATKTVFDSTWENGTPTVLVAADATTSSDGTGVISGFAQALIGQQVGSQVLVSIPADLAYPDGSSSSVAGESLLFVFDVLGIQEGD